MAALDPEEHALRDVALRNASAIHLVQQRAEDALRQAKQDLEIRTRELSHSLSLMQLTLESTDDGILVIDSADQVVTFNEKFLETWKLERGVTTRAKPEDIWNVIAKQVRNSAGLPNRFMAVQSNATDEARELVYLIDGRVLECYSRPQFLESQLVGRAWSFRDVTARNRVDSAVQEEAKLLELLHHTGIAISANLDISVVLQAVTDAATQLSGAEFGAFFYTTTDDTGQALTFYTLSGAPREAFDRFGHPRATALFAPTFAGDPPVRCDDVLADPRYGHWAPHHGMPPGHLPVRSYLAVPVASRRGEPVGGLFFGHALPGVFTERTERLVVGIAAQASVAIDNARLYEEVKRVAAEREVLVEAERAARADIARVSRLKDDFLATLSHELRTPLTAILGWSKLLPRKTNDPEALARGLQVIERNAKAQVRLIDDLLDMNRIISGKVRLDVQPIDMAGLIDAALDAIRPAAEAKGIALRSNVNPVASPIAGDPNRLQQVIWNLLTNAVKFTPEGGWVEVNLLVHGPYLQLMVSDSGEGIPIEFLPHVFDRFRQADSSITRSRGGLGLGLSIVKQLVELHGGIVSATSEGTGKGATFTISLPFSAVYKAQIYEPPVAVTDAVMDLPNASLEGLTVLVVDDEDDARDLVSQVLQEAHANVHTASSAQQGLLVLKRLLPDLLISDIGMPELDGYQLMRQVRRLPPEEGGRVPAIALTAFASSQDRTRAMMAGFQVHVSKPIEPHELVAAAASVTGRMNTSE